MWLILSFINAVTSAGQNAYYKKVSLHVSPFLLLWSVLLISSIFFSPLFFFGTPHIGSYFWIAVTLRLIVDTIANLFYIKGVSLSPLSLTIPMLAITPVFILLFSFFINHLEPSFLGLVGIFITIFGIYFLNFDHDTRHFLSPFKAIYKDKGVLYVAITAILWGLVNSLMKLGIDNSNATFYTASFQVIWLICLTPVVFFLDRKGFLSLFNLKTIKQLTPVGLLDAIQLYVQNIAFTMALPVYVSTVERTSILFSSLFGWLFFKEKIQRHVIPTAIIVIGIILITFAQK